MRLCILIENIRLLCMPPRLDYSFISPFVLTGIHFVYFLRVVRRGGSGGFSLLEERVRFAGDAGSSSFSSVFGVDRVDRRGVDAAD